MTDDLKTKIHALHVAYEKAGINVSKNGKCNRSARIIITSDEGTNFAIRKTRDGSIVSVAYRPERLLSRKGMKSYASRRCRPYVVNKSKLGDD